MEVSEELMLTWGSHQLTLVNEVAQLRHRGCFADVTLACEGHLYLAHKFILAMCSDYFRNIFGASGVGGSNSSLVVVLKDVTCQDVEHLLDYMYTGVVAVEKSGLHSLIRTAENLQIKGLAFADSPDVPPLSPERHDPSAFVGGTSRQEEVITEDHSPTNSRKVNTMGPDVRLNRIGSNTSQVPVNSREGVSPPSKRKRLQDSLGQAISNSSNTSTTFTNNVRTSSLVSQQQIYSSKRRVSSPGGQPSFCSSSPTDVPLMPIFTEPQSPVMPPGSPLQFRQAGGLVGAPLSLASKSFKDSSERQPGSTDHHSPVSCYVPTVVSSSPQTVSVTMGHSPKGRSVEGDAQRPENLEIKKEEPDGDAAAGAATEIHLSVDGGGPSNEASELKEEPPPEEGESGPSGLHASLECWGAAAAAEGGLLADVADDDEISDTDGTGVCWAEAQDKRYRCEWCGKNFRLSVHLKDHIRTHTGEKPYHCLICKKNFTQRSNLRTHLAKIHNEQLAYVKTRRRGHVTSSGITYTAATIFSDGTTSNAQLSQATTATTPTGLLYKGMPAVRQLSEHGGEGSSSVDTVNASDIGIESTVMISSSMDAGKGSPAASRKRVWSTGEDVDEVAPSSGATVVPYLSKETLSYLTSPTDAHYLQVAKLGPGGEGFDGGAGESAGVGQSSVGPAGAAGTPFTPSPLRGSAGSASAATPLNPVPLTPDPLLKTLLLKGGHQPNNLVTFDVSSSSSSPSSDKFKRSLIFTSTTAGSLLPNNSTVTEGGGNSQACVTAVMSACHQSPSPGKLASTAKAGPSLAAVSGVDDATISATFTFHPNNQLSLPANLSLAGKDMSKSVTLSDVANKGSSTLLKLPSFMVIEASGIAPSSSSQITIPVSVPSSNEEPQQHNMEILLQAIDMKETSPAAPGKSSSCQSVPTVVSSHLPQLTLNLQPLQSSGNVQLAARLPGSPLRASTIHKSGSTLSPVSPMPVSLNSPLFSSFAIQRPSCNNSFSSSPPILASPVLSHLPASLNMSSATAISLPVYSLSPSCSTSNSSGLPLLTTVAPHVLTSSSNLLTNSTSSSTTVLLSPPTVVSSSLLTLPSGASVLQHHSSSSGVGECLQRRMTQIFREVDAPGNSVTASASLGCGPIVFTTLSHEGKTVTAPPMPDKVTVNIGGQEMTVHSSGSKPVLVEGRQKEKKVLAAMSDAMGVARFSGHHQTIASSISVQQGTVDVAQNGSSSSLQGGIRSGIPFTAAAVTYQQLQPGGIMAQRVLIQPHHKQQQIKKHPQNLHQPPAPQQIKQILPGSRPIPHAYQPITPHQTQQSTTSQQLQQQQRGTVVSLQQQQQQQQQHQFSTLTHEQLKRIHHQQQQVQQQQMIPSRVFGNKVEAYHGVPISLVKETAVPRAIDYGVQGAGLSTSNSVPVTASNNNTSATSTATVDNIHSGSNVTDQDTTELPVSRTN